MDEKQAKQTIDRLTELVLYHSRCYYEQDAPEIEDYEYDQLLHQLMNLEKAYPQFAHADSPTRRVVGRVKNTFEPVEHKVQMGSLQDVFDLDLAAGAPGNALAVLAEHLGYAGAHRAKA